MFVQRENTVPSVEIMDPSKAFMLASIYFQAEEDHGF